MYFIFSFIFLSHSFADLDLCFALLLCWKFELFFILCCLTKDCKFWAKTDCTLYTTWPKECGHMAILGCSSFLTCSHKVGGTPICLHTFGHIVYSMFKPLLSCSSNLSMSSLVHNQLKLQCCTLKHRLLQNCIFCICR